MEHCLRSRGARGQHVLHDNGTKTLTRTRFTLAINPCTRSQLSQVPHASSQNLSNTCMTRHRAQEVCKLKTVTHELVSTSDSLPTNMYPQLYIYNRCSTACVSELSYMCMCEVIGLVEPTCVLQKTYYVERKPRPSDNFTQFQCAKKKMDTSTSI